MENYILLLDKSVLSSGTKVSEIQIQINTDSYFLV